MEPQELLKEAARLLGRKGGQAKSARKLEASRLNLKKSAGRPRGTFRSQSPAAIYQRTRRERLRKLKEVQHDHH